MNSLAIFGFGLIGASLAAAVRRAAPATRIVALDLPAVFASAAVRALSDEQVDAADRQAVQRVAAAADLCVLAAPVSVIVSELPTLLESARVVTDCGSTKGSIGARVSALPRRRRFVPGHPMAGGPEGGAELARADLFQAQTWLLCPDDSDPDAVAQVEALVRLVGANVVHLNLAAHDRAVAYTSHAPQLFASALAVLAAREGALVAAGPTYRAITRGAGGAELMWRDIFAANGLEISVVLRQLAEELEQVAVGLEASPANAAAALALLAQARIICRR
jgi:prephenate dehydrogenase